LIKSSAVATFELQHMTIDKLYENSLNQISLLRSENLELKQQVDQLKLQMVMLQRMVFGSKSERQTVEAASSLQGTLFDVPPLGEEVVVSAEQVSFERRQTEVRPAHPGRHAFPEHLRREEHLVLPTDIDTTGMRKIGEDVREQLSFTPSQLFVRKYIYPKFLDSVTGLIYQAPALERSFSRYSVDTSVASHVVVQKTIDHLPLYRQARIFERQGVKMAESTLGDIYKQTATILTPLYEAHRKDVLDGGYLNVDETTIRVQDSDKKGATHQGYYWVYYNNPSKTVLFVYDPSRARGAPQKILKGFRGYLQTDGYSAYEEFGNVPGITLVCCMAHARRKFFDAKMSDKASAEEALAMFGQVYAVEKHIREMELSGAVKLAYRQQHSVAALKALHAWMMDKYTAKDLLPSSPIHQAVEYTLKRWDKLILYAQTDLLDPDNHRVENSIRPVAIGRKNYLFAGSHDAAQRSAMLYSMLGTCKAQGVEPFAWLNDVLKRLPFHPINRIKELLPQYYQADKTK
jgi:transposase